MTVSNSATNLSALALRSSSLLVSSAKSGTSAGYAPEVPTADAEQTRTMRRWNGDGDPSDTVGTVTTPKLTGPAPAPAQAPVRMPVKTDERPVQAPVTIDTDGGDHDRYAHYAKKDDVTRAYVTGEAITALCGKKWVPTRDPTRYPICPTCVERKAAGWKL